MTPKQLDRLRKLLALALDNPSEHEAKSAALQVCRMLREHNVLGAEVPQRARPVQTPPSNPQPQPSPFRYGQYQSPFYEAQARANQRTWDETHTFSIREFEEFLLRRMGIKL